MRRVLFAVLLLGAFSSTAHAAAGAEYPARPIRLIVPFAPGGSADNLARTLQPSLSDALGQSLVIDNRPGASSIIGTDMTAKAAPDGYTLLLITTTHTVNPALMPKLPFDAIKDFSAVSLVVSQPNILVVHPSVAARSVKELIALAKAKPNTLAFASGGNGSSPHLSGELLKLVTGVQLIHVPYKGSGPGITDLLGGHVQMMFAGPLGVEQYIKAGRLRALAVADARRSAVLPDVPTMAEAGVMGVETGTWYGMLAPARTPPQVIDTLYRAIVASLQLPDVKTRLLAQGVDIVASTPQQFADFLRDEVAKWAKVVKDAKVQAN